MTNPLEVNHVIIGIEFLDETGLLIETTSDEFYSYDEIKGWKIEI